MSSGTRVTLAVTPVDPLDLARGSYVDLAYDIDVVVPPGLTDGDDVYVELRRPAVDGEAWEAVRAVADSSDLDEPDAFIQLSVDGSGLDTGSISTYYADSEEALRLQDDLADGGLAEIVLDSDGAPTLDTVRG